MPTVMKSGVIARFYENALRAGENDCWIWTGCLNDDGYGKFQVDDFKYYAHVISYMIYHNLQRIDLHVLHSCDNPRCHNPKHLFLGTQQDNNKDKCSKGRQAKGESVHIAKLTEEQVLEIREKFKYKRKHSLQSDNYLYTELAKEYNVDRMTIYAIIRRKSWSHLPE